MGAYENCDIVLTPNETNHAPGKTMYFDGSDGVLPERQQRRRHQQIDASDNDDDELALATAIDGDGQQKPPPSLVPWEQPLKHALYLVLNNKIDEEWNGR